MTNSVWLPDEDQLCQISAIIEAELDEAIKWRIEKNYGESYSVTSNETGQSYCWERDTSQLLRHNQHHLQTMQLNLEFLPASRTVHIIVFSIPTSGRGKGSGTRIIEQVVILASGLGYKNLSTIAIPPSINFWTKTGFETSRPSNTGYFTHMQREL